MVTYEDTYQSFIKYRAMIGLPPIGFEDWMHKREDAGTPKTQTKDFLDLSSRTGQERLDS